MLTLDRIINEEEYKNSKMINLQHTWKDFEDAVGEGKFCLFGVGAGANYYFFKYGDFSKVKMVVDNNKSVQGYPFKDFTPDFESDDNIIIESPTVLEKSAPEGLVVLISSLRHYDEIAQELETYGIKNYYSVLCMEARERELNKKCIASDKEEQWVANLDRYPINTKKICVSTNCDGAGHAKEIIRELIFKRQDLDIVWMVRDLGIKLDKGIRKRFKNNRYASDFEYSTSGIWIGDSGGRGFPVTKKKTGQIGIELKHWSSVTLKKFNLDENGIKSNLSLVKTIRARRCNIDFVMVGSDFDEKTCRSGFGIDQVYIHVGSPRSDILFKKNRRQAFISQYPFLANKKLLLYAPTFRRTGENMSEIGYLHELDFDQTYRALMQRFGGEWCILLRLHPAVAKFSHEIKLPDYVVDVSDYQDSEELVASSDALITDYSSIMFEPAYIYIPVFLLATDVEEYTSKEREFYIEYESLPFPIAQNNKELEDNILAFDEEKYRYDLDKFFAKYGVHEDGHAAERAAKFISDLIDGAE